MSKLDEISKEYRDNNVNKNVNYSNKVEYNSTHNRAISDGDEFGKNDNGSGSVGSLSDIKTRETLLGKNPYVKKEYNSANNG